jgi:TonB family protein
VKSIGRVVLGSLFFTFVCFAPIAHAKAATEFCAATLFVRPVGVSGSPYTGALYGFTLDSGAPKIASAELAFETNQGWYSVAVPAVMISRETLHFIEPDGTHRAVARSASPAMYLRFPQPVSLTNAFVLGANGQACPPQPRWGVMPINRGPAAKPDPQYPDKTTLPPQAGDVVLTPAPTKALFNTNCLQPFQTAGVKAVVPPDYPEPLRRGNTGTAQVLVTINPGGSLADATVFQSSGDINFDRAALRAARETTYNSAVAYCQAVPGKYLFKVTFQ